MVLNEDEMLKMLQQQENCPNLSMIEPLEEYLDAQVAGSAPYSFRGVHMLVKLYHIFPSTQSVKNLGRACFLAMVEYPRTDMLAISYMIPLSVQHQDPCANIRRCMSLLNGCKFEKFWNEYETLKNYGNTITTTTADETKVEGEDSKNDTDNTASSKDENKDTAISDMAIKSVPKLQQAILGALALSYKTAPLDVVKKAINLSSDSDNTDIITSSKHVKEVTADSVVFHTTTDNSKRQHVYQEGVNFQTVSSLLNRYAQ